MKKRTSRLIIYLFIFLLSFNLVTDYKEKEVQAAFVIDDIFYIMLGLTVLGTGIVAANNDQVKDMGNQVWNEMRNIYNTGEKLDAELKEMYPEAYPDYSNLKDLPMIITDGLKQAISNVSEKIVDGDIYDIADVNQGLYSKAYKLPLNSSVPSANWVNSSDVLITVVPAGKTFTKDLYYQVPGDVSRQLTVMDNITKLEFVGFYHTIDKKYQVNVKYYRADGYTNYFNTITRSDISTTVDLLLTSNENFLINDTPYYSNPVVTQGYNPTVINQRFDTLVPGRTTTISPDAVVSSQVLDRTITVEDTLTWDMIKDLYITKDGTVTVPGEVVVPGDVVISPDITMPSNNTKLDFSPLYVDLSRKFPFCIPFDVVNLVSSFNVSKKRPTYVVNFPELDMFGRKLGGYKFTIDFAFYDDYFPFTTILRYVLLVIFVFWLVKNTKRLIWG